MSKSEVWKSFPAQKQQNFGTLSESAKSVGVNNPVGIVSDFGLTLIKSTYML